MKQVVHCRGLTFLVSMRGMAAGGCSSAGGSMGTGCWMYHVIASVLKLTTCSQPVHQSSAQAHTAAPAHSSRLALLLRSAASICCLSCKPCCRLLPGASHKAHLRAVVHLADLVLLLILGAWQQRSVPPLHVRDDYLSLLAGA